MRTPKESMEKLDRINKLLRNFDMFKGWVNGEAGYMLYNPENKEKFMLDEYDTDLILMALGMLQLRIQREVEQNEAWCKVNVHVDIPGLMEKDRKQKEKHKKKRKGSREK